MSGLHTTQIHSENISDITYEEVHNRYVKLIEEYGWVIVNYKNSKIVCYCNDIDVLYHDIIIMRRVAGDRKLELDIMIKHLKELYLCIKNYSSIFLVSSPSGCIRVKQTPVKPVELSDIEV
jgi:hypothetical protein